MSPRMAAAVVEIAGVSTAFLGLLDILPLGGYTLHKGVYSMQRQLFRHGFGIITAAFMLGAVTATAGMPQARLWVSSHVTAILTGLFVCGVGAAWPHLALGERGRRVVY